MFKDKSHESSRSCPRRRGDARLFRSSTFEISCFSLSFLAFSLHFRTCEYSSKAVCLITTSRFLKRSECPDANRPLIVRVGVIIQQGDYWRSKDRSSLIRIQSVVLPNASNAKRRDCRPVAGMRHGHGGIGGGSARFRSFPGHVAAGPDDNPVAVRLLYAQYSQSVLCETCLSVAVYYSVLRIPMILSI